MMRVAAMAAKASLTPTRLYLVRHGQVADGHTDRYHGNNDIGLSDNGVRQFEELAAQLAGVDLAGIYASDLTRARTGAEIISRGRSLAPQTIPEFRDLPRLNDLINGHPQETIIIVAHAGVNRVILSEALGLPLDHLFRLDQNYGCLNVIDYFPDMAVVRLINGGVNGVAAA